MRTSVRAGNFCQRAQLQPLPLFYRNSGVFDTEGNLVTSGAMDSAAVKRLQTGLPERGMFIVVDLVDTWIRPFLSDRQRHEAMDLIVQRAPFLITKHSVFLVSDRASSLRLKCKIADLDVKILDCRSAKTRIFASTSPVLS